MNKETITMVITAILLFGGFITTCHMFDSDLANTTIDWLSFIAGCFLAWEAAYKMRKHPDSGMGVTASRWFRIIIGACIFFIHLVQFIWGTDAPVFKSNVTSSAIDWMAFYYGIFLIIEGVSRTFTANSADITDIATRLGRATIGSCVFTIHLLQFMRY